MTAPILPHAEALIRDGFHVFLCAPGKKRPMREGWQAEATRDPSTVRRLVEAHPAANLGIYTQRFRDDQALLVVDIDPAKGGEDSLLLLDLEGLELPATRTHTTARGGRHLIYRVPEPVKSGTDVLGPGLDIRSAGGLIVGPGSVFGGGRYAVDATAPAEVAPAPAWLIARCGAPKSRDPLADTPVPGVNPERARERATRYLREEAPEAIEGAGGDLQTFKVAAMLRDYGVTEAEALELMLEHYQPKCFPPWEPGDMREKVRSAYRNGRERPGIAAPEAVFSAVPVEPYSTSPAAPAATGRPVLNLVRAADIEPEPIDWLWPGFLAASKLHVLAGAPGTGKTTIGLALAAGLSVGAAWPDGIRCPVRGSVLVWSGEDGPADTLIPRLLAMGAAMDRVFIVGDMQAASGARRSFDPAADMQALEAAAKAIGDVRLLIVDPLVSAVAGDSHKNAEVRRGLQPLVDLAESLHCAVLGISHFTKGTSGRDPVERITGSLAFGALARVVLVAAKDTTAGPEGKRMLVRAKSNIGPDGGGFEYDLVQGEVASRKGLFASRVAWKAPIAGTARDLLASMEKQPAEYAAPAGDLARTFLLDFLQSGPRRSAEVQEAAEAAGLAWSTVRRAKDRLRVIVRQMPDRTWTWALPEADMQADPFAA